MSEDNKINGRVIANARVTGLLNTVIKRVDGVAVNTTAFSTGLLDTYGSAAAAYSVRRLNSSYTGACMRVRESGGNTETDIGFNSAGNLDVLAIRDHCGSNGGYVRYWYDQSTAGGTGSGNDAGQATSSLQPQIYNGTAVLTQNGKPALDFEMDHNFLLSATLTNNIGVFSVLENATQTNDGSIHRPFFAQIDTDPFVVDSTGYSVGLARDGSDGIRYGIANENGSGILELAITKTTDDTQILVTALAENGTANLYVDGGSNVNTTYTPRTSGYTTQYAIGVGDTATNLSKIPTRRYQGKIQEIVAFNVAQSSNRTSIESDINTYFSIY